MSSLALGLLSRSLWLSSRHLLHSGAWTAYSTQWKRLYSEVTPKYNVEYFNNLVKNKPLVLFMKGEPSAPMCGFSRLVVQILAMHGVEKYDFHNILEEDVEFKEGMKKFSNWPTFPQLYMNGELVGGADIALQMHQSGEFISELEKIGHLSALLDKSNDESR